MKTLILLGILCLLHAVMSQPDLPACQLPDMMLDQIPFPDIEKLGIESYQMAVEFTLPKVEQTDYYTEYYDSLMRMGRVDSHQEGENLQYIYRTDTAEAWNLKGDKCDLKDLESTPDFFRNYQENWLYMPKDRSRTTIGPSAMFKMAYDKWNSKDEKRTMAYLGEMHEEIRGLKAQVWRWCETPNTSVDFFFTAEGIGNAYSVKLLPLRVHFLGKRKDSVEELSDQYYDIIGFQPFISLGLYPFRLPKGKNCRRLPNVTDVPDLPDFSNKNLFFSAEVVYRKVEMSSKQDIASFYSTLRFAVDVKEKMIAYRYSPWNTTQVTDKDKSVREVNFLDAPEYVIYDMLYGYAYLVNYETGKCEMDRGREFSPSYKLPQKGGSVTLTDASILFPNNELYYLTDGFERGVYVDIFESAMENYVLDGDIVVPKVTITHSYLHGDERVEGESSTQYAPTQVQLRLYRTENVEEILTFNFFGFTTKLPPKNILFDVRRCFKNDDDYSWVTFGFEAADGTVPDLSSVPIADIQYKIMEAVDWTSLTPLRVPTILVDIKEELYVSLMILEKPPLQLDFVPPATGKGISGGKKEEGIDDFNACARACLQKGSTCWGLSMCGNDCVLGTSLEESVEDRKDCNLFTRYDKEKMVLPKKSIINSLSSAVTEGKIKMMIKTAGGDQQTELRAMFFTETDPASNDPTFDRMGHNISPRMRIFKQGSKLKKSNMKSLGKMRFEECQRFCLDFKDCETVSYCLIDSDCGISTKYGEDIKEGDMESDSLCEIVTKKYAEHFVDSPGYFVKVDAASSLTKPNVEECAQACLKNGNFKCLSFDYCGSDKDSCRLHTTHYLNKGTRKEALDRKANCIHYTRKYSTEFKKNADKRVVGAKLPPITNLTLEECAKACIEYGQDACLGYDFCQGTGLFATSCTLLDTVDLDTIYSPICTNYLRDDVQLAASRPYSNGYAGGIGFLCFLIGGILGAVVVFGIAYCRVNRR